MINSEVVILHASSAKNLESNSNYSWSI